eukprot:comp21923_c0_seq1/m.31528 comp21923_c0_seq1/g.31528  ORF comp21923_c0_seq1/g.31528 comp21923_c0_seq1/m.31528 type:complete len:563 (-) comp21923_c0_seq1:350-2038(-)
MANTPNVDSDIVSHHDDYNTSNKKNPANEDGTPLSVQVIDVKASTTSELVSSARPVSRGARPSAFAAGDVATSSVIDSVIDPVPDPSQTIHVAATKQKVSPWLLAEILVAAMPTFNDGYNISVINNSVTGVFEYFAQKGSPITNNDWSSFVSLFLVGGMISSLMVGPLCKRFGPKRVMTMNDSLYVVSAVLYLTCKSFPVLCLARTVSGMALGINMPVMQILVQECSPTSIRGFLGMSVMLAFSGAMVVGFALGMHGAMGNADLWHWLYGISLLPAVLHFVTSWFVPESPRWLLAEGREEDARAALRRLRHRSEDCERELGVMKASISQDDQSMFAAAKLLFTQKRYIWPLVIGNFLPILVQFTCGSFVAYYSKVLFAEMGFKNGELATVLIGVVGVVSMFITGFLIERLGRKGILLYGWGATAVIAVLIAIASIKSSNPAWNTTGFVLILIYTLIGNAPASISMMVAPELFPNQVRSVAVAVCNLTARMGSFVAAKTFLLIIDGLGQYLFFLFAGGSVVGVVFVALFFPETRGISLEEIENLFDKTPSPAPKSPESQKSYA